MIALAMALAVQAASPNYVTEGEALGRVALIGVMCWQAGVAPLNTDRVDQLLEDFRWKAAKTGVSDEAALAAFEQGMDKEKLKSEAIFSPEGGDPATNERLGLEYLANSCAEVMTSHPDIFVVANEDAED